jgi:CubicO group peptidase (beta-lactamase class C family)
MRRTTFAIVPFLLAALTPLAAQAVAGDWRGNITIPGSPLAVVVHLSEANGSLAGTIDIPAQEATGLQLAAFERDGQKLAFRIEGVPGKATFRGELSADGTTFAGTFTQAGQQLPFSLRRDGAEPVVRFDELQGWLDETRTLLEAPGVAVAIVDPTRKVTTLVSGLRDPARQAPVTADTLFAIGSSTKAFTTCLMAMLVDDGKLAWDEPVRRWLPDFALADATIGARLTPRDLVTHRSGMPRHDLVWYGATFDRAAMVKRLRHLPLNHDLRSEFQYNNLMYLTAGHLAEQVGGASWEDLVRQRILQPLDMPRANFRVAAMQADADHAVPHGKKDQKVQALPFRDITAIGPAGSINASVREMANWASLQLQRGRFGEARLLSTTAAEDLHVVRMPPGSNDRSDADVLEVGYALGWFVDVYRGHLRVHHGGNIDGFSALVALLPDAGYGFVVLTNMDASALPDLVVRRLSDQALGLEPRDRRSVVTTALQQAEAAAGPAKERAATLRRPDTKPSLPLADYAGDYADAGYGPCRIQQAGDALQLDLHGLQVGLSHWHHDVFVGRDDGEPALADTKVQFLLDFDGEVEALRMVLDPHVGPIVFSRQADARLADPAFLRQLAGRYEMPTAGAVVTLVGQGLVVTLPGQRYELEPKRGLRFSLRGLTGYSLEFELDAAGKPTQARFLQPNGVFVAVRKD